MCSKINAPRVKIVLQKHIAGSGYCSRRQAEELIRDGKVMVNGSHAELGQRVDASDDVRIRNTRIEVEKEKIYIKLNKPRGYVCTNRDFDAEQNVFELIDDEYRHLHIVGRLDKNSHGLVILTNDGDFTAKMTHPRYEHEKEYLVRIKEDDFDPAKIIKKLQKGVDIGSSAASADLLLKDGQATSASSGQAGQVEMVKVKSIEQIGEKMFKIILTQGKKRQIRRMFEALGYKVSDLERVRISDIMLGDLKVREWEIMENFKY